MFNFILLKIDFIVICGSCDWWGKTNWNLEVSNYFTLIFDSQTSITCSTATRNRRGEEKMKKKNHASHGSVVV